MPPVWFMKAESVSPMLSGSFQAAYFTSTS